MDVQRIGRLVRDLIKDYGLACELVSVQTQGDVWRVLVRHTDGREVEFDVPHGAMAQVRALLRKRLEIEC
jgi:hypothetical protein